MSLTLTEKGGRCHMIQLGPVVKGSWMQIETKPTPVDGYLEAVFDSYFLGEGEGEPREKDK